jgi:hypothetical protein
MNARTFRRTVLCLIALATAGAARAQEEVLSAATMQKLRSAYDAFKNDAGVREIERRANANPHDRTAVDALLKRMPLSPLEHLQIDMEVRHYEIAVPRFLQELHVRWMRLNEPLARSLYGDEHVDQVLAEWPVDYGDDITSIDALATVGTNRNAASTASPAPNAFDGEIQIAVNHRNTNQMVASANTWGTAGTPCNNNSTLSVFYSSDGGATWGYTCAPSNNVMALGTCTGTVFGSDPALYWNDNNEVFLDYMLLCSTTTSTKYSMVVARSTNGGATWTKQGIIKNAWATGTLEDKNFYAVDNTAASPFYGRHYTCWDRANNEKFAYSSNNGVSWTEVDLPSAGVGGIDLGCEIAVEKTGTVHVVFDSLTCSSTCTDERMWYTKSTNGGVSWSTPVQVHDNNLAGFSGSNKPPVEDNRGINPFGAIDVDNSTGSCSGTLYAVFSDYVSGGATETDVWLTRSTNGGTTWGTPVKINDDGLAGRTQFHPFVQVDQSNGNVIVAWHDARNDTNNRKVEIYAARSANCGVSFEANVKASQPSSEFNNSGISYIDENTTDNGNRNPNQYGEYMGLDVKNNKAYIAWTDTRHFYPGSTTNAQKENVGFATIDFGAVCVPPAVPTGVTATAAGQSQINVSWNASAGAITYNILRSTTNGGPYVQVGTSATTSFSDTGLACNTTYYYVIQAASACTSANSAQAQATTSACPACTTTSLYTNNFDSASGLSDWTKGTFLGGGSTASWIGVQACTAKSGANVFRYGGSTCTSDYTANDFNFAMPKGPTGISVPAGATTSRLSFWHRRDFESGYDGATLALSVDGGASYWYVPPSAILSGTPYNGTIAADCPPAGAAGATVFTGNDTAFTNTVVDLDAACNAASGTSTGCAGRTLRIVFISITDCTVTGDGWFLDDVNVTSCVPSAGPPALDYFTATPCRLVDTRDPVGPDGGPALQPGVTRTFALAANCGIPVTAKALSVNITAVEPTSNGNLSLFPAGETPPTASSINFQAGLTRANNALLSLSAAGAIEVLSNTTAPVDFILDVTGWFEP